MNDKQQEAVSVLNSLIETCEDGRAGYRQAAEHSNEPQLSSTFSRLAQQRTEYAEELRQEVRTMGGEPAEEGTVAGKLYRGWMNIKENITGNDPHAIIADCEKGEDQALENYRDALEHELPQNVRSVVERQFTGISQAHDHIRSLEKRTDD